MGKKNRFATHFEIEVLRSYNALCVVSIDLTRDVIGIISRPHHLEFDYHIECVVSNPSRVIASSCAIGPIGMPWKWRPDPLYQRGETISHIPPLFPTCHRQASFYLKLTDDDKVPGAERVLKAWETLRLTLRGYTQSWSGGHMDRFPLLDNSLEWCMAQWSPHYNTDGMSVNEYEERLRTLRNRLLNERRDT